MENISMEKIMEQAKKDIGLMLREKREELGFTVLEISEISKISRQTIYSAEDGVNYSKKYVQFMDEFNIKKED